MDAGPGGAAHIYEIVIQDPPRLELLIAHFADLEKQFPFQSPPIVVSMEVAVDFYSRSNDRSELMAMTQRLICETANDGANPRQFLVKMRSGHSLMRKLTIDDQFEYADPRNTYNSGKRNIDPIEWRIYLKETDNNKPILDVAQHRARIEITLRGDSLSQYVTTLHSLDMLQFQVFSKKFACRTFVPPEIDEGLPAMQRLLAERKCLNQTKASRIGQCALWVSKRRKFSEYSRADIELNTMIRESLRGLTQRFNTKKRGKIKPESAISPLRSSSALLTTNTVAHSTISSSHPSAPL